MRTLQVALVAFVVGALSSTAEAQSVSVSAEACELPHATGVAQAALVSGDRERAYRLFLPATYDGGTRLPLVLDLHGSNGSPAGQARTSGFESVAAEEGFAVATLQAEGAIWNVPVRDDRPDVITAVHHFAWSDLFVPPSFKTLGEAIGLHCGCDADAGCATQNRR